MILSVSGVASCSLYTLGVGAALQDMARRKVANRWIAGGLAVSLASVVYLGLNTALGERHFRLLGLGVWYLPSSFYGAAATHFALSVAAALALWYLRVWPAGDAKLYIALSSLLVLINHNLSGFPRWLFLITLINIFVTAGIFVAAVVVSEWIVIASRYRPQALQREFHALLDRARRRLRDEWGKRYNYLMMGWNTMVMFLLFSVLIRLLRLRLPSVGGYLGIYLALYFGWRKLRILFIRQSVCRLSFFVVTFIVLPMAAYLHWDIAQQFLRSVKLTVGFDFFLISFRRLVDLYLRVTRRRTVPLSQLREGMILSDESWERLMGAPGDAETPRYADGLSGEELRSIGPAAQGEVSICWHRPFALWIFLGCLWTLYAKVNVVQWLTNLAHR